MRVLLDAHVFVWWVGDHPRLSDRAREIIAHGATEIYVSSVSVWELLVKAQLGRVEMPEPARFIPAQLVANGFEALPLHLHHVLALERLPAVHRDPFDRMLVAQATVEGMAFVSADRALAGYPVELIW